MRAVNINKYEYGSVGSRRYIIKPERMNEFRMTAGCGLTRASLDYSRVSVSSFLETNIL